MLRSTIVKIPSVIAPVIHNQSVFIALCLTSAASWFLITNWRMVLCLYILLTMLGHSRTALRLEVSMTWCSLARVAFLFLTRSFPCSSQPLKMKVCIHSIDMCRTRRFLARSQELLPFLSVMHFFLPPFSTNYSTLSHLILPSVSWSTSPSSCSQIHI